LQSKNKLLSVFVILKNGRRLEDISYLKRATAEDRLLKHRQAVIHANKRHGFKDSYKFEIVETTKPNKYW
jgi:hypothetical protein